MAAYPVLNQSSLELDAAYPEGEISRKHTLEPVAAYLVVGNPSLEPGAAYPERSLKKEFPWSLEQRTQIKLISKQLMSDLEPGAAYPNQPANIFTNSAVFR